ncbi:MAG: phosphate ABC transporter permease subunit PstC [Pseudomonadota bacterium]
MDLSWLIVALLVLGVVGFIAARQRAIASADGDIRTLHSRPNYYGYATFIFTAVPGLLLLCIWLIVQPTYVSSVVMGSLPEELQADTDAAGLAMADVRRVARGFEAAVDQGFMTPEQVDGLRADLTLVRQRLADAGVAVGSEVEQFTVDAARVMRSLNARFDLIRTITVLLVALGGLALSYLRISPELRARNITEKAVEYILIAASTIAILTTVGIVMSMLIETRNFFGLYPASEFFFGLTWAPSFGGGSELGILPLLWGTFYISVIALSVAVPIGLFAAIYLAEYASPRFRSIAKPALEVLAGIPTIVYGLFALVTVGPFLVSVFGNDGLGWMGGGRSVVTAGVVMGVMLIPFVSSLSDDIINAVPQAMRDGSLGLGATKSETIRQVVIPAALPGIIGAILLAASRAIGETMIVVMGAGAAARLSLNPFDAMTTVTAKIVSQLTGDADFASPEALVAFALGMTLFVVTLALNVFALYIVRRYREQYE